MAKIIMPAGLSVKYMYSREKIMVMCIRYRAKVT